MSEPVTLEFLSKQADRALAEMQAMREDLRAIREIVLRCIATAKAIGEKTQEMLSLLPEAP